MPNEDLLSKVASLAKRRGFIFPSSEIYGGLANTYDFGPYGVELKENIKKLWWQKFIRNREDMFGIDASVIINPKIWESSGHVANFADVMVEDKVNRKRYRADHLIEEYFASEKNKEKSKQKLDNLGPKVIPAGSNAKEVSWIKELMLFKEIQNRLIKNMEVKVDGKSAEDLQKIIEFFGIKSPDGNELSPARKFSTLFETEIGIVEGGKNKAYLRGEIAQGIFINYKNVLDSIHPKLPFGIGQAGKAYRNEITKGKLTIRTLEFDLMEFEYFYDPEMQNGEELFEMWRKEIHDFALSLGLNPENLRWRRHEDFELSHYSNHTEDLEYKYPWGFGEMFACADRTNFDLRNHMEKSGQNLEYTYPEGKKLIPFVLEPTFGLSRVVTTVLIDSYCEDNVNGEIRTYLKLEPSIAPVKFAVFPLTKDERIVKIAKEIYLKLKEKTDGMVIYDESGSIGKRYRRQDEIGTPICITVDFESLEDGCVTTRDRDTLEQKRVKIESL